MSKRQAIIGKLETLRQLAQNGLMNEEGITQALEGAKSRGDIPAQLPLSAFEKQSPELLEFCKKYGLVKEKGTRVAAGGRSEGSYASLITKQYPHVEPLLMAVEELRKQEFTVTDEEGATHKVRFMPFYRDVTPKADEGTPSTEVTV
jgi:hypothetical protein